jgi:hypothetical protein
MFWYLEATWRGLSHFMSVRINQIEDGIEEGNGGTMLPLQLYSEWEKEFTKSGQQTWKFFFKSSLTRMPHIFIAFVSLALFLAVSFGWIVLVPFGN